MSVQQIKEAFYDPKVGLWSVEKVYKKLREQGLKVSKAEVKKVLENQTISQVYKPVGKYKKKFTSIVAPAPRANYQVDLLDLQKYSKFNRGFKYMFNAVDVHSRYAYSVPIKTKGVDDVVGAFQKVMKVMGIPKNLNTDLEKAILGGKFQAMLKEKNIKHWQVDPDFKRNNAIVERFNRTIRSVLQKYFYSKDTKNWVDILPDLLENYNSTEHSTIKAKPIDVWNNKDNNKQKLKFPKLTIKVGDKVRILKRHSDFVKKSDVKVWTKNIYTVERVEGKTYFVKSEKGVVQKRRDYELQKVDADAVEQMDNFKKTGEGKEFKKELGRRRAERRLRKEDIESDLVDTAPAEERRVPKAEPKPEAPKKPKKPSKYQKGVRVSVKYPDKTYEGVIDEVVLGPRGGVIALDIDFDDGSSAVIEKEQFNLVKILS